MSGEAMRDGNLQIIAYPSATEPSQAVHDHWTSKGWTRLEGSPTLIYWKVASSPGRRVV